MVGADYWDKSDANYWRCPFTQADWLETKKRAMAYVSKYMAKVDGYSPYEGEKLQGRPTAIISGGEVAVTISFQAKHGWIAAESQVRPGRGKFIPRSG